MELNLKQSLRDVTKDITESKHAIIRSIFICVHEAETDGEEQL